MDKQRSESYALNRRQVVKRILANQSDLLVVSGLGAPSWDVTANGDRPLNFPLWGAMGGAAMMGLGLALAQPSRRVLVITGDGEMLMGMGAFASIAAQAPHNLSIVILDNERYGETGMQATHTAANTDLAGIAAASGIATTGSVENDSELAPVLEAIQSGPGPSVYVIKVRADAEPLTVPPKDGAYLKDRFRVALLGTEAAVT